MSEDSISDDEAYYVEIDAGVTLAVNADSFEEAAEEIAESLDGPETVEVELGPFDDVQVTLDPEEIDL